MMLVTVVLCIFITAMISKFSKEIVSGKALYVVPIIILVTALISTLIFIYLQPSSDKKLAFSVPLVPFLPAISILINIYLMMMLDMMTWIRFLIWMIIGKYNDITMNL
ncbi:cationic amino acid transporter 3 [Vespula maculifrons]|uniref:Cationic amino acid transporter 3 n=1 Tax=Vespula maculifrons TaxID=7453 RepID=A0ABD2CUU2_VESMC